MKKQFKNLVSLFITVILVLGVFTVVPITASAAGDTISTATSYTLGSTVSGSITDYNTKDFYKFTLPTSGRISLNVNAYIYRTDYYIYDLNGNEVWKSTGRYWNDTTEKLALNENIDLTSGTYYLSISVYSSSHTGNYNLKMTFSSSNESFIETTGGTNNTISTPNNISLNTTYYGQIAKNDSKDFYKFTLPTSGRISLNVNAYIYRTDYYIYDSNGNEVWESTWNRWNDETEKLALNKNIDLTSGTYYLNISGYLCYDGTFDTGNYNFKMDFTTANESFKETTGGTNNTISTPNNISLNTTYYGQIAVNDSKDFYKFTLPKADKIKLSVNAYVYRTDYYIYDSNGNEVWQTNSKYWNDTSKKLVLNESVDLTSGTYYLNISGSSYYDGSFDTGKYNFQISSANAPTSIKLNKTSVTLGVGESVTLTKTVTPSNASTSYTWSSSNTSVATVSTSGKITAKKTGTANITVKTSNGKTATCKVTVKKAPGNVWLNKTKITLGVGEQYDFNCTIPSGTASYNIKYTSSNSSVATVKASGGIMTAKKAGTAVITATTHNGKKATCTVTVKNAPSKVSLNKTKITLGVGEIFDFNCSIPSGTASYRVKYTSSNSSVATVKASGGIMTAKKAGTAVITATTYNGKKATCTVTVKNAPSKVSLNKTKITLGVGETFDFNSSLPSGTASYRVKYTSSNSSVATVKSSGGLMTAKKVGTAVITATTYNGKKVSCTVTVKNAPSKISLNKTKVTLRVGQTFDLNSSLPSGTASYSVKYTSNNTSVATVKSSGGLVTAKKAGTARITAKTYNGKTVTCVVTVK